MQTWENTPEKEKDNESEPIFFCCCCSSSNELNLSGDLKRFLLGLLHEGSNNLSWISIIWVVIQEAPLEGKVKGYGHVWRNIVYTH